MDLTRATPEDTFVENTYVAPRFGLIEFLRRVREDQLSTLAPELFDRSLIYNRLLFPQHDQRQYISTCCSPTTRITARRIFCAACWVPCWVTAPHQRRCSGDPALHHGAGLPQPARCRARRRIRNQHADDAGALARDGGAIDVALPR